MTKAVLFDFDGVLTLDETGSRSICNYVAKATGVDKSLLRREYARFNADLLTGRLKHEEIWQALCDALGARIDINILRDSFINTPLNAEVLDIVRRIKAIPLMLALVTDNKADRIKSIAAHHCWETVFDCIAVSAEIGSGKENEDIFRAVTAALAVSPGECVFIDNKEENLVVPQAMGMRVIHFDFPGNDVVRLREELAAYGVAI